MKSWNKGIQYKYFRSMKKIYKLVFDIIMKCGIKMFFEAFTIRIIKGYAGVNVLLKSSFEIRRLSNIVFKAHFADNDINNIYRIAGRKR